MPSKHLIKEGECIESVAFAHGFSPATITCHPENSALLEARGSFDAMIPGDEVFIPDLRIKELSAATGARHRYRRKGVPARFRVFLREEGESRAGVAYTLDVDGRRQSGRTGEDGMVEHWISPAAKHAELRLEGGEVYSFDLGCLRPVSEAEGVNARLRNLGYPVIDGDSTSQELAIEAFQLDQGAAATGHLDEPTRKLLHDVHGS